MPIEVEQSYFGPSRPLLLYGQSEEMVACSSGKVRCMLIEVVMVWLNHVAETDEVHRAMLR